LTSTQLARGDVCRRHDYNAGGLGEHMTCHMFGFLSRIFYR